MFSILDLHYSILTNWYIGQFKARSCFESESAEARSYFYFESAIFNSYKVIKINSRQGHVLSLNLQRQGHIFTLNLQYSILTKWFRPIQGKVIFSVWICSILRKLFKFTNILVRAKHLCVFRVLVRCNPFLRSGLIKCQGVYYQVMVLIKISKGPPAKISLQGELKVFLLFM